METSKLDISTIVIFFIVFIILYYIFSQPKNLPPAPPGWPVIGNMLEFSGSRGKLPELFSQHAAEYGNIFRLQFGGVPVIIVNGYDSVNDMLVKKSNVFSDRPDFLYFTEQIGTGVILSSGQKWKDLRRMSLHALRDFGMGKLATEEKVLDEVNVIIGTLSENENKPILINKHLAMASSNIICNIIFGSRFEYNDGIFQKMIRLLNDVFSRPGLFQICNAFPLLRFIPRFRKGMQDNIEAFDRFARFVSEIVQEHEVTYDKEHMRDFIDMFIKFRNEESGNTSYSLRNFLRLIIDLFMAGTETTSTTLNWAILYMIANPYIQVKCQEEIEKVVGHGRLVKIADRVELPYVEATIYEVQRLATITPLSVPHATLQHASLGGFNIPKESIVIPNIFSVHMDPKLWPDPEQFQPERFLKDGKVYKPDAFMPFSTGPRQCAGEALAKMELFLYFTNLLQCFTFKKPDGTVLNLEGLTGLTRSPRPFEVIAVKR